MSTDIREMARRVVHSPHTPQPVSERAIRTRDGFRRMTARWRVLPDFVITGVQKGGTTSLYDYLTDHPQVVPAFEKEVHYFDHRYDGRPESYRLSFPPRFRMARVERREGAALTGEASPYYFESPHIAARAAAMLPRARFIALLRNPVDRAVSAFHHNRTRTDREPLERFEDAVEREMTSLLGEYERCAADESRSEFAYTAHCYLQRGIYVRHIERWFEAVGRERMLVLQSEHLERAPDEVYERVLEFLGLPPHRLPTFAQLNTNSYDPIDPDLRAELVEWFRPHNERLFEVVGERYDWT